jgi:hypothetical protein
MPNELKVGIVADASGVDPGINAAVTKITTGAEQIAAATNAATVATKNLAAAQVQLGQAAAAGSVQAAQIIAEYAAANTAAAAAVQQVTQAAAASTPVIAAQGAAANTAAAAVGSLGVSARQGASAGIGILEGRMMSGNRAAAAFLTTTLGLGPAIQAAFPILGALAMGEVLIDIGKNAYEAYEKFISLSAVWDKLADDVRKMQTQDFVNVHSIETATQRLNLANDAASRLRDTAEQIHKVSLGDFGSALLSGNLAGLASAAAGLAGAHGAAEGSAERTKQSIELQSKVLADQHELNNLKIDAAHSADAALSPEQKITAEYSKRVALAREEQQYNEKRDRLLGNSTPSNGGAEALKLAESAAGGEAFAARAELNKKAIADFVSESITDYRRVEAEGKAATEAITAAWVEGQRAEDEGRRAAEEAERRAAEDSRRIREQTQTEGRQAAQAVIEDAARDFAATQADIRSREQLGLVSHRTAVQMLEDAEKLREVQTQGALSKEAGLFDPIEGGRELQAYLAVQDKMTEEAHRAAAERQKLQDQETQAFVRGWRVATQDFSRDFTQAFNSVLTKQDSTEKAFGKMFGAIELQLADFVLQWIAKQTEMWLLNKVLQASGLASQQATQKAAQVATIANDAGVAGAGTMAYWSAINPIIAPAMASTAVAETLSFAAYEHGGMVGGSGGAPVPIIAHAGERVLSAGQTSNFDSLVNNSGGPRTANLNQENHFHGGVTDDQMAAHTAQTLAAMRGMMRPEALA